MKKYLEKLKYSAKIDPLAKHIIICGLILSVVICLSGLLVVLKETNAGVMLENEIKTITEYFLLSVCEILILGVFANYIMKK